MQANTVSEFALDAAELMESNELVENMKDKSDSTVPKTLGILQSKVLLKKQ